MEGRLENHYTEQDVSYWGVQGYGCWQFEHDHDLEEFDKECRNNIQANQGQDRWLFHEG